MFGSTRRGAITTTLYTPRPGTDWAQREATLTLTESAGSFAAYGASDLAITEKAGTFLGFAYVENTALTIAQPAGTFTAYGGGEFAITGAAGTFSATAETSVLATLSIVESAGTFSATAVNGCVATLTLQQTGSFSAYCGSDLTVAQPAGSFSASGVVGSVGALTIIQPAGSFASSIENDYAIATLSITQPAGYWLNGDLSITQPAGSFVLDARQVRHNLIAYAMNIKTAETTQYSNYAFDFIIRIGHEFYGVKSDGLYQLTGITDNGTAIEARFKIAETDFGTSNLKRVPYCYVDSDKPVNIAAIADGSSSGPFLSHTSGRRTHLARGPKGKIWQLEVSNVNGNEMKVGSLEALAEVLSRKI